jgi:hypothetical protein
VKNIRNCFYLLVLSLFASSIAQAQATRTWVSGVGDDANPCSRTAPCKTFAGAISKTLAGGEIDALDPGGFGALTITKAITIDGGAGQVASVLVSGTNAIVVSAGASDTVTLRNLSFDGLGTSGGATPGINGIMSQSGGNLHIEHCTIFGFSHNGIDIEPTSGGNVTVSNTISRDNSGSGIFATGGAAVSVTVSDSQFTNNVIGVFASDSAQFAVRNSDASGNSLIGFCALANGGSAVLNIASSMASNNSSAGVQAGGGGGSAVIRLTGVSTFNNGVSGWVVGSNGSIVSFGNNYNSGTGAATSVIAPK